MRRLIILFSIIVFSLTSYASGPIEYADDRLSLNEFKSLFNRTMLDVYRLLDSGDKKQKEISEDVEELEEETAGVGGVIYARDVRIGQRYNLISGNVRDQLRELSREKLSILQSHAQFYRTAVADIFIAEGYSLSIGTDTIEFSLTMDNDGGIMARGVIGEGNTLTTSGAGTRLMWYPRKAAFRMGYVDGDQWDEAKIYSYSVAMGYNAYTTGGEGSVAMGLNTSAIGTAALALGEGTTASANWAVAMGNNTTASGLVSTAMGSATSASGAGSTAMGANTTASGWGSIAMGELTEATAKLSTTFGRYLTNNTTNSFMVGFSTYQITVPSFAVFKSSVGIGTATPEERLHIAGNIKIDSNIINIVGALSDNTVTVDDLAHNIDARTIGFYASTAAYADDSNLLDGLDSSEFAQLSATQTFTGQNTFSNIGNIYYGDGSQLHGIEGTQPVFFLSDTASDIGGRYVMSSIPTNSTASTFTVTGASAGETIISSFTTLSGAPNITLLVDGIHHFHFHAKKTGTKDVTIKAKVYKRTSGGTETLLYTLEDSSNLTTDEAEYNIHHFNVAIELDVTDRLVLQVICIVSGSGAAPDVSIYAEANSVTRMEFPFLTPTVETFVPYSGALSDINLNNKAITNINLLNSNNAQLQISTNVYIVGYSSATTYYGSGSNLTGIPGGGDMLKSTYDTDDSGIVDNSELLSGKTFDAFVSTAGDTMSGDLDMGSNDILNVDTLHGKSGAILDLLSPPGIRLTGTQIRLIGDVYMDRYDRLQFGESSSDAAYRLVSRAESDFKIEHYDPIGPILTDILQFTSVPDVQLLVVDWANSDDGSGSELDADLLDGLHATDFSLSTDLDNVLISDNGEVLVSDNGYIMR